MYLVVPFNHSSILCSITLSCIFFFCLGLTSAGVNVTLSAPSTVDFLCFGIALPAEEGSGSARPILDLVVPWMETFRNPNAFLQQEHKARDSTRAEKFVPGQNGCTEP